MINDNEKEKNENSIDLVDINEEEITQDFVIDNDDELNINITIDDVIDLTEDEAIIIAQKVEVEIEKYEDILIKGENEFLTEEDILELGFNPEEYKRLKMLDKAIYSHIKKLRKQVKEKGFFSALPTWAVVIGVICALFTIIPVNPYLPFLVFTSLLNKYQMANPKIGMYIFYFCYVGLFLLSDILALIILLIKSKKNNEKKLAFKAFIWIVVINLILAAPGIYLFVDSAVGASS